MRVTCSVCGEKAVINKSDRQSVNAIKMYCSCSNCEHRFVWVAGFCHTISGGRSEQMERVKGILGSMSGEDIKEVKELLGVL